MFIPSITSQTLVLCSKDCFCLVTMLIRITLCPPVCFLIFSMFPKICFYLLPVLLQKDFSFLTKITISKPNSTSVQWNIIHSVSEFCCTCICSRATMATQLIQSTDSGHWTERKRLTEICAWLLFFNFIGNFVRVTGNSHDQTRNTN